LDDETSEAIKPDFRTAPISEVDRNLLEYVVRVTKDATRVGKADHEQLRAAGFDDRGILQITLIAAWFNYINRLADALGVGRDGPSSRKLRRATRSYSRDPARRPGD
jgi:alkylhydroperoxidase family enzyme